MKSTYRNFGFLLAVLPLFSYGWLLTKHGNADIWLLALSIIFCGVAVHMPKVFGPFYKLWQGFALLLNKITSPILMLLYFIFIFIPVGFYIRVFGATILLQGIDSNKESYWINVDIDNQSFDSLKNQY
ncbi:MAG: hypothetical protein JKY01_11090 [Pseudomonadales bacterium]|nr:hypothetical protein [Pseudomonadales bacterium]